MKNRQKNIVAILIVGTIQLFLPSVVFAQSESEQNEGPTRFAFGFSIQEWKDDFGIGLNLTSPWFLYEKAAIRLLGAVNFKEDHDWKPYYLIRLGLLGGSLMESADIRLYGEGGVIMVIPDSSFDSDSVVFGGFGHFGVEFFTSSRPGGLSYFIELGSNAINAKTTSGNLYLNGFANTVGLRFYP